VLKVYHAEGVMEHAWEQKNVVKFYSPQFNSGL
jgi:hypothetical protein